MRLCPSCAVRFDAASESCPSHGSTLVEIDPTDPLSGKLADGRFVVLDRIGAGSYGRVYRAHQRTVGRTVALKVLAKEWLGAPDVVARFQQEAQVTASLRSPHSVTVHDCGNLDDGSLFIAMELLEGATLRRVLEGKGWIDPLRAARILEQITLSLEDAHGVGLVHRDLKPENVFLVAGGGTADHVKVVDFGLAKVLHQDALISRSGTAFGTPRYMAPEQCEADRAVSAQADLYALGVMAFEMLTGRPPFSHADAMHVMHAHVFTPAPLLREHVPYSPLLAALEPIVARCLAKSPRDRPASAAALRSELAEALRPKPRPRTVEPSAPPPPARPPPVSLRAEASEQRNVFLERVRELCLLQEGASARVEVISGQGHPPYLRVTSRREGFGRSFPVALVEEGLTQDSLRSFVEQVVARYRRDDPGARAVIVVGGAEPMDPELRQRAELHRVQVESFVSYQGLIDFTAYVQRQTARLEANPIYPASLYVPQVISVSDGGGTRTADALKELIDCVTAPRGCLAVLLGSAGRGKTFLLYELARELGKPGSPIVPILVPMRKLVRKAQRVESLVAQQLVDEGESFRLDAFRYMLREGRIALLFDGFDEIAGRLSYESAAEHLDTVVEAAVGDAKVVLTSRPEHFATSRQLKEGLRQARTKLLEKAEAVPGLRLGQLLPFGRPQIRQFLINRLGTEPAADERLALLSTVSQLVELCHNPRLLSFVVDLSPDELRAASIASGFGGITSGKLYELLVARWLRQEVARTRHEGAAAALDFDELFRAVTQVALAMWGRAESTVSLEELTREVAAVLEKVERGEMSSETAAFYAGSGSLLIRDEDDRFSFVHQSLLEWFVAAWIAKSLAGGDSSGLARRELTEQMATFLKELAPSDAVVAAAKAILGKKRDVQSDTGKKNALMLLDLLGIAGDVRAQLASADLRGRDLSGSSLRGSDLRYADLRDSHLERADLTGADLTGADLRGADLSGARMAEANLSGADLSGATLIGATLAKAKLAGAKLRQAAMVGAVVDTGALASLDTWGAALPEADPVPMFSGAMGCCTAVAWSPSGDMIATGDANGAVRLWKKGAGVELRRLGDHRGEVTAIAFTPDGALLASAGWDGGVVLWAMDTGERVAELAADAIIDCLAVSADGARIAGGDYRGWVHVWRRGALERTLRFEGPHAGTRVLGVAISDRFVAASLEGGVIALWRTEDGAPLDVVPRRANGLAIAPDGKLLAAACENGHVALIALDDPSQERDLPVHVSRALAVTFSADGKTLAASSATGDLAVWTVEHGAELVGLRGAHAGPVHGVCFSTKGTLLASAGQDGRAAIWSLERGVEIAALQGQGHAIWKLAFSHDSSTLFSLAADQVARAWTLATGEQTELVSEASVIGLAAAATRARVAVTTREGCLYLGEGGGVWRKIAGAGAHENLEFSRDGSLLARGGRQELLRVYPVEKSGRFAPLEATVVTRALAVSASGVVAGATLDGRVRAWIIASGARTGELTAIAARIHCLAFAADGGLLLVGAEDGRVYGWKVGARDRAEVVAEASSAVVSVQVCPDGRRVVFGCRDGSVHVVELRSGKLGRVSSLHAPGGPVQALAIRPHGNLFATGGGDGSIHLWSLEDLRRVRTFFLTENGAVAISADGRCRTFRNIGNAFWYASGLCRLQVDQLDRYVDPKFSLAADEPLL